MKRFLPAFLLAVCCISAVFGLDNNIRTIGDEFFVDVKLKRVTSRGLVFMHSDGVTTLTPEDFGNVDKMRYAKEIKEHYRLRAMANERRKLMEKDAVEIQQLFDEDIIELRKLTIKQRIIEGYRILRRYRMQLLDFTELRQIISDAEREEELRVNRAINRELKKRSDALDAAQKKLEAEDELRRARSEERYNAAKQFIFGDTPVHDNTIEGRGGAQGTVSGDAEQNQEAAEEKKADEKCSTCNGSGRVTKKNIPPAMAKLLGALMPCPVCKGTGKTIDVSGK